MILKPFMLRRVKKHVQKELGEKVSDTYGHWRTSFAYARCRSKSISLSTSLNASEASIKPSVNASPLPTSLLKPTT